MKQKRLTYRFHNPNPAGVMEKALERLLIDNGVGKVHSAICEANEMKTQKGADTEIPGRDIDIV